MVFTSVWYLPAAALDGRVDVLLQQLLGLQLVDAEAAQQLSDLLTLQRLHAAQQGRVHHAEVLVQGVQRRCNTHRLISSCTTGGASDAVIHLQYCA